MDRIETNTIISSLYSPDFAFDRSQNRKITWDEKPTAPDSQDRLPIPPPELRMDYGTESDQEFLDYGLRTYQTIRGIMDREGIRFVKGDSLLDWGCASGRVLRHFVQESAVCELWGPHHLSSSQVLLTRTFLSKTAIFVWSTVYLSLRT